MKQELKKELCLIIDAIEDEQTLSILKEDLTAYTLPNNIDGLTTAQLQDLDEAIKEADTDTDLQD